MAQHQRSSQWRVWHRWLSLIFGVQMVIWTISGGYMVFFQLDFIHGDHLVQDTATAVPATTKPSALDQILERYPHTTSISLETRWLNDELTAVYQLDGHQGEMLVDAQSLNSIVLEEQHIRELANRYYALETPQIESVVYLTENPPTELNPALLPIWQVNYDDFGNTSLYLSEVTGEMLVKRHTFWRGFDIMWMTHIMDYNERVDIETWWLKAFIIGTFILMITGAVLLVYTISFKKKKHGGDQ
ncbi:hypothetical protein [Pseudidiomarina terrestris]|uniref:PepSY domain-containing protein n=1 Tax=Pseudidiomarina terrestris TaxID=2820060 RepID=A0AAW7QZT5_9GAMM|nr:MULTISPECIES: hypothetical protein [unclassified Pseudidiomarina]MDN7124977.1 hypothetical protein [Pseudidiomarina sp. 1APP75-32.1]MDN7126052.1 hypothetical protein [Pseudidiomarina sp. 1APR75-33.1]MDN7129548.1 hypothetical protein [Pseudidiomarina sp. 1APR75-15]MDN7135863.1 hypothetical protein [Pseudidiomarina sp. 1ASP75-5]MDN7138197.1 hypothetical protein [Pseudidiomarina sp. 1ASP75-14]